MCERKKRMDLAAADFIKDGLSPIAMLVMTSLGPQAGCITQLISQGRTPGMRDHVASLCRILIRNITVWRFTFIKTYTDGAWWSYQVSSEKKLYLLYIPLSYLLFMTEPNHSVMAHCLVSGPQSNESYPRLPWSRGIQNLAVWCKAKPGDRVLSVLFITLSQSRFLPVSWKSIRKLLNSKSKQIDIKISRIVSKDKWLLEKMAGSGGQVPDRSVHPHDIGVFPLHVDLVSPWKECFWLLKSDQFLTILYENNALMP